MEEDPEVVSERKAEQLTRAARTAAGERLRSVTYLTPDAFEQVYLRSDLERGANVEGFVEQARDGFAADDAYRGTELGDYRYTIRRFETGSLVRVTAGERGVFATAESLTVERAEEIASALQGVIAEDAGADAERSAPRAGED